MGPKKAPPLINLDSDDEDQDVIVLDEYQPEVILVDLSQEVQEPGDPPVTEDKDSEWLEVSSPTRRHLGRPSSTAQSLDRSDSPLGVAWKGPGYTNTCMVDCFLTMLTVITARVMSIKDAFKNTQLYQYRLEDHFLSEPTHNPHQPCPYTRCQPNCHPDCEHRGWEIETELRTLLREARKIAAGSHHKAYDIFAKFISLMIVRPLASLKEKQVFFTFDRQAPRIDMLNMGKDFITTLSPLTKITLRFACRGLDCANFQPNVMPTKGLKRYNSQFWDFTTNSIVVRNAGDILQEDIFHQLTMRWQSNNFEDMKCLTCGGRPRTPIVIIPKTTWLLQIDYLHPPYCGLEEEEIDPFDASSRDFQVFPYMMSLGYSQATAAEITRQSERVLWRKGMTLVRQEGNDDESVGHTMAVIYSGNKPYFYDGTTLSDEHNACGETVQENPRIPEMEDGYLDWREGATCTVIGSTYYTRAPSVYSHDAMLHQGGLIKVVNIQPLKPGCHDEKTLASFREPSSASKKRGSKKRQPPSDPQPGTSGIRSALESRFYPTPGTSAPAKPREASPPTPITAPAEPREDEVGTHMRKVSDRVLTRTQSRARMIQGPRAEEIDLPLVHTTSAKSDLSDETRSESDCEPDSDSEVEPRPKRSQR